MTTSAPQWPGQEGIHERRDEDQDPSGSRPTAPAGPSPGDGGRPGPGERPPLRAVPGRTGRQLQPLPRPPTPTGPSESPSVAQPKLRSATRPESPSVGRPESHSELPAVGQLGTRSAGRSVALVGGQGQRRVVGRLGRFEVVRDQAERNLSTARRRARARLPSPVAVTRELALALLEVEAGCRSAAQLERVVSAELWGTLERCIGRRGGPLPSGRSVIAIRCQEDQPGLADTVAVVCKGDVVRPIALRLDAGGGRWVVTELRWWRNETDTATTPGRDGGRSR